jgi:hypothetical protein
LSRSPPTPHQANCRIAPLGEASDDESTGSSIPYNDAEEQQNLEKGNEDDQGSVKDEDEDEDEGV